MVSLTALQRKLSSCSSTHFRSDIVTYFGQQAHHMKGGGEGEVVVARSAAGSMSPSSDADITDLELTEVQVTWWCGVTFESSTTLRCSTFSPVWETVRSSNHPARSSGRDKESKNRRRKEEGERGRQKGARATRERMWQAEFGRGGREDCKSPEGKRKKLRRGEDNGRRRGGRSREGKDM
eukprot:103161-Rhodomonas_salina.1